MKNMPIPNEGIFTQSSENRIYPIMTLLIMAPFIIDGLCKFADHIAANRYQASFKVDFQNKSFEATLCPIDKMEDYNEKEIQHNWYYFGHCNYCPGVAFGLWIS